MERRGDELDDEWFNRLYNRGIMAPIRMVAPDTRLLNLLSEEDLTAVKRKTKYFELSVIDPRSILTIEAMPTDECSVGENVEITLVESGRKYSGSLRWTGSVNKLSVGAVSLVI